MIDDTTSPQPPHAALATGVLVLAPQSLPFDIPFDRWVNLPESLQDVVFDDVNQRGTLDAISDLCLADFAWATVRGRRAEATTASTLQLYIRLYLFPISFEQSRHLLKRYHDNDMRERPRKLKPSNALALVLANTSRHPLSWQCQGPASHPTGSMFFEQRFDNRGLSEIFQDLPSPRLPRAPTNLPMADPDRLLCEALTWYSPPGMRTTLFPYQRRTVWRMLQQELRPGTWSDPRYIQIDSMDGRRPLFFNPFTYELREENDVRYDRVKGGILCEEMGSGKTAMCLAICLATKGRVALPPNTHTASMALSMDSLTWPGVRDQLPPHALNSSRDPFTKEPLPEPTIPSLRQLAQFVASTRVPGIDRTRSLIEVSKDTRRLAHFDRAMESFAERIDRLEEDSPGSTIPFYLETAVIDQRRATRDSSKAPPPARPIRLSALTLILVPSMIHQQWSSEILKHCEDNALRVMSVPTRPAQPLPPATKLIREYDVILITHERFAAEAMPATALRSPLLDIRFQRLIIDEGHVANGDDNNRLKELCLRMSIESRWIVTGTPTKNIKGIKMGSTKTKSTLPIGADVPTSQLDLVLSQDPSTSRTWSRSRDGDDLKRLGNMFEFLAVPPFVGSDADWKQTVMTPLLASGGPGFGAVHRLRRCLEAVMIHHRVEDIEQDVPLPGVTHELVTLGLTEHSALMHNALLAQIAINSIDSERTDQDYLFHPKNRGSLGVVVKNLSQSLFWHVDNETDYAERVRTAIHSLDTAKKRGASAEDIRLVEDSITHLSNVRDNINWTAVMQRMSLPFHVDALPPPLRSWVRDDALFQEDGRCLLEPERIHHIRGYAGLHQNSILADKLDDLSRLGHEYKQFDAQISEYVENLKQFRQGRRKNKSSPAGDQENTPVMDVQTSSGTAGSPIGKPKRRKLKPGVKKEPLPSAPVAEAFAAFGLTHSREIVNASFPPETPLTGTIISSSLSSKVNYLLSDVLQYATEEKIVIFSSSALSLSHLTEAFELYGIRFLHFHNEMSVRDRENTVQTFETSDVHRVLLMELKHGARGLNLVSASRVYFCEPVWRADEESQAIKRCHRIGQKRPVTVKTLVIHGTAEEEAVRVRNLHPDDQTMEMEDDLTIKHFIAHPKFLKSTTEDFPLLRTTLLRVRTPEEEYSDHSSTSASRFFSPPPGDRYSTTSEDVPLLPTPPRKKRKTARFDDTPLTVEFEQPPSPALNSEGRGLRFLPTPPETPNVRKRPASVAFSSSEDDVQPHTGVREKEGLRVRLRVPSGWRAPAVSTPAQRSRSRESTPALLISAERRETVHIGEVESAGVRRDNLTGPTPAPVEIVELSDDDEEHSPPALGESPPLTTAIPKEGETVLLPPLGLPSAAHSATSSALVLGSGSPLRNKRSREEEDVPPEEAATVKKARLDPPLLLEQGSLMASDAGPSRGSELGTSGVKRAREDEGDVSPIEHLAKKARSTSPSPHRSHASRPLVINPLRRTAHKVVREPTPPSESATAPLALERVVSKPPLPLPLPSRLPLLPGVGSLTRIVPLLSAVRTEEEVDELMDD